MTENPALSIPIVNVLSDPADQRHAVLQEGCRTLGDLTKLTAYQTWQLFGARINAWREPSRMFADICGAMEHHNLSWLDTSPGELTVFNRDQLHSLLNQQQRNPMISFTARMLSDFHLGPYLLPQLSHSELQTLRLGEGKFKLVLKIQDALKQK